MGSRRACYWMVGALLLIRALVWAGDGQIDIASLPYTISEPGSYVVVANLTLSTLDQNGIMIAASGVSLDLNGHTLTGPGKEAEGLGEGISAEAGTSDLTVRNGTVRDWAFHGIDFLSSHDIRLENLSCLSNGDHGILSGDATLATGNICSANATRGLYVAKGGTVTGNICSGNGFGGLEAFQGCTISKNVCASNTSEGIAVQSDCLITDNLCDSNQHLDTASGIRCYGQGNVVRNNVCTHNDQGIDLLGGDNVLSGNVCKYNTIPIHSSGGNQLDVLVSEIPYVISEAGVYRLSGTLTAWDPESNGILILADDVTLDLGGHSLIGPGKEEVSVATGIETGTVANLCIRNGTVRDWPIGGILALGASHSRFEDLEAVDNGNTGLYIGSGCTAVNNVCNGNGEWGLAAVEDCLITGNVCRQNGVFGIGTTVQRAGCSVLDNICNENTFYGIAVGFSCTVRGNTCSYNGRSGIDVFGTCQVIENTCCSNGSGDDFGAGITARWDPVSPGELRRNVIERNMVTGNDEGIQCNPATGNYIAANRASGNTTDYNIALGNTQGTGDLANVSY